MTENRKPTFCSASPTSFLVLFMVATATSAGCQSTIRKAIYSAYETVGIEKRNILKRRVDKARDEQKDASDSFQDALETFKKVYVFEGGKLEKNYSKAKDAYDRSAKDADNVHSSIDEMETVAGDLFKEWEQEARKIETASMRSKSLDLRTQTMRKYSSMLAALKKSESRMDPILHKLNDQVLFLKHNLNAKAVASLQGESQNIERDLVRLIADMKASIAEAEGFVKELD